MLDPARLHEYDNFLKYYCEVLNRWSMFNKRIEIQEYLNEIPQVLNEKFGKLLVIKIKFIEFKKKLNF